MLPFSSLRGKAGTPRNKHADLDVVTAMSRYPAVVAAGNPAPFKNAPFAFVGVVPYGGYTRPGLRPASWACPTVILRMGPLA